MDVYIYDQGTHISCINNLFVIKRNTESTARLPLHMVESISMFGNVQMTTQAINTCLSEDIPILYYSYGGHYNGKISSEDVMRSDVVINQCKFLDNSAERLSFDKSIIEAKINNQLTVLRRYDRTHNFSEKSDCPNYEAMLKSMKNRLMRAEKQSEIMGIEGISGKIYFKALGSLFSESRFTFKGRNKRPPKDPFNAALSMGYTFLLNILTARISSEGLVAEIGMLHSNGYNRPALSCDLMEEWRQPIVDSTVIGMLLGNELLPVDFDFLENAVYLGKNGIRKLINKLHGKMQSKCQYIHGAERKLTFYEAVAHQIHSFRFMVKNQHSSDYQPIVLR
ncbi:CRISPR-associated endonuclease Cas1 [Lachnospiraceae bacterium C1.1]|nr:CRISPR-associated endonuclease Cas1 [Lachnospiraceae bacterium C1.1]